MHHVGSFLSCGVDVDSFTGEIVKKSAYNDTTFALVSATGFASLSYKYKWCQFTDTKTNIPLVGFAKRYQQDQ